ncbi:unnamed protein product [Boreogadus saida]
MMRRNFTSMYVANTKKNQITSHLLDDAVILIEKLNAGPLPKTHHSNKLLQKLSFQPALPPPPPVRAKRLGVKPETVETVLSASPATSNWGTETGNKRKRRPSTKVDTLPTTSPATTTIRGTETGNKRKRHPSTKVKTVLSTSPNTTTNGGRETETVETVLSASPAITNNDWQNTKRTPKDTQPIPPLPPHLDCTVVLKRT